MKKNHGILVALLIALAVTLGSSYALYASVVRQVKEVPASVTLKVESCILELELGYADSTLTMDFELGTKEPALWSVWLVMPGTGAGVFRLWASPIPIPIDPPTTFPLSFPLPDLGTIGFLTALSTSEGVRCIDVGLVDTGGEAPSVQSREGIRELFPRPNGVLQGY